MALLYTPSTSFLRIKIPTFHVRRRHFLPLFSLSFPRHSPSSSSFRLFSFSCSSSVPDEWGEKSGSGPEQEPESKFAGPDPSTLEDEDEWGPDKEPNKSPSMAAAIPDEWGEKSGPEPELESAYTRFTAPDPAIREDEDKWGPDEGSGNGGSGAQVEEVEGEDKGGGNLELKKCLVDTVYGSDFGFRASAEVRAEASELVTQLEAANPTPSPAECPALLDGNWVLVYTAASELLPLLAVGSTPLLKVEQISQAIDTANRTIENSTTLASPLATCSFSATATFEVRTPSRIQVQFKEATFKPPEIRSQIAVPESVDIFGQRIPLSPVQQLLNPLQGAAAGISRTLYGLPPLKIPLPGERTESWLLITYLDEDLQISRGDGGGLFVLVREGSPLLGN